MILDDLSKLDRRLLILSSIVLAVTVLLLSFDGWMYQFNAARLGGDKIGQVRFSKNDVRMRSENKFSWAPTVKGDFVIKGDRIFTGPQSEAVIVTKDGDEIVIAPNSLIVIKTREDSLFLDIDFGSIQGKLEKDSTIMIGSGNQVAKLNASDAQSVIKVDVSQSKDLVVNVLEGEAKVTSNDVTQTVSPDQGTEVLTEGQIANLEKAEIQLTGPLVDSVIDLQEKRQSPVLFSWNSSYKFNKYLLQIARDPEFTDIVSQKTLPYLSYEDSTIPQDQKFYWRVQAEVKSQGVMKTSKTAHFLLMTNSPPKLQFPDNRQILRYTMQDKAPEGLHLLFRWGTKTPSRSWEIELAQDPEFKTNKQTYISQTTDVLSERLTAANYYWRVRAKDYENARWSETFVFQLQRSGKAAISVPVAANGKQFELESSEQNLDHLQMQKIPDQELAKIITNPPDLTWNNNDESASYRLQISRDKGFKDLVVDRTTVSKDFRWQNAVPGEYYWRVQSVSAGEMGPPSQARKMEVLMKPPTNRSETEVVEEVPDLALMNTPPQPLQLKWSPTLKTKNYKIQFSADPNFTKPVEIKANDSTAQVRVPKAGQYYWRVRSEGDDGKAVSNYSPTYSVNLNRTFKNPERLSAFRTLSPKQNDSMIVVGQGKDATRFQWTTPFDGNAQYEMQVSDDKDFKSTIVNHRVRNGQYNHKGKLPEGWLYWRVRVVTKGFASPWLSATRFQVIYQKKNQNLAASKMPGMAQAMNQGPEDAAGAAGAGRDIAAYKPSGGSGPALPAPQNTSPSEVYFLKGKGTSVSNWTQLAALKNTREYATIENAPLLKWNNVAGADNYTLEVSQFENFTPLLLRQDLNRNEFSWKNAAPGRYYWRVSASSAQRQASPYTQSTKIEVRMAAPRSITPAIVVNWDEPSRTKLKPFQLEWTPVPTATGYQVQFAKDPRFEVKKDMMVTTPFKNVTVSQAEMYYWRVRAIGADTKPISGFSPVYAIKVGVVPRVAPDNSGLQSLFPANNYEVEIDSSPDTFIPFEWSSQKGSGTYTVEIAETPDFANPAVQEKTDQKNLNLRYNWQNKRYYWRVGWQSVSGGAVTWAKPQSFQAKIIFETRRPASRTTSQTVESAEAR